MKILLDTHALLWWLFNDPKLSTKAHDIISNSNNIIIVSSISAWEISTKHRLGKLPEAGDIVDNLTSYLKVSNFSVLEISLEHALLAGKLPPFHRDPFDRMLIAQSLIEKIPIITVDHAFKDYSIPIIWE
jgi:PIN domain nuclease of toxin-antitoxin system